MPESSIYRVDDIEIDATRGCIVRGGQEVPLKPKAFRVLVHLLKQRDRLVSKEELMELFWTDTAVTDDALTQCIARLRRALGDDPRQPHYLKTVPRMGYRFVGVVEEVTAGISDEPPEESAPQSSLRSRRLAPGAFILFLLGVVVFGTGSFRNTLLSGISTTTEPKVGELAWWKLDEAHGGKIHDAIHGLAAALPAGISWTTGISGSALSFPGREIVLHGNDSGVLPKGNAPRTFTAWVKTRSTNGDSTILFASGDPRPETRGGFGLMLHESGAAAFGYGHFVLAGKHRIDDDSWHQVAATFDGAQMRLFVDGIEEASAAPPPEPSEPGAQSEWAIGSGLRAGTGFRGALDDIRVYAKALRAEEIWSLHRCMTGSNDAVVKDATGFFFAPVWGNHLQFLPEQPGARSAAFQNTGNDFAGIMFVRPDADCALSSIHGADIGQDLNTSAELLVPPGPNGSVTDAGPYFRSRSPYPGDGIVGGTSAGFWLRLDSTGQVRVQRLHPMAVVGFSIPEDGFDPHVFHKLEAAVHGETLEAALDGKLLTFEVAGQAVDLVPLRPSWDTASPKGHNDGSAGIALTSWRNRGQAGGQQVRNIHVGQYQPLSRALPWTAK